MRKRHNVTSEQHARLHRLLSNDWNDHGSAKYISVKEQLERRAVTSVPCRLTHMTTRATRSKLVRLCLKTFHFHEEIGKHLRLEVHEGLANRANVTELMHYQTKTDDKSIFLNEFVVGCGREAEHEQHESMKENGWLMR
eukprot:TRINITY_DN28015_c0_g1_i1.p1 TRINITY_DN28015_c0_g1~~TRINITY_DN28015_c0_g1_i1.p1  ORF type:complete len:139 (-),score=14.89 TRINITY_DN28015_c0_g1_i1:117-533(-)